jgi:hypothetical protein
MKETNGEEVKVSRKRPRTEEREKVKGKDESTPVLRSYNKVTDQGHVTMDQAE